MPFGLQTVALRMAAGRVVERTEERDQSVAHCARCDLIARIPFAVIRARRDAEAAGKVAFTIGHEAVELVVIVRLLPRSVVVNVFAAEQQMAVSHLGRSAEDAARVAEHAAFRRDKTLRQRLEEIQVRRARR